MLQKKFLLYGCGYAGLACAQDRVRIRAQHRHGTRTPKNAGYYCKYPVYPENSGWLAGMSFRDYTYPYWFLFCSPGQINTLQPQQNNRDPSTCPTKSGVYNYTLYIHAGKCTFYGCTCVITLSFLFLFSSIH